LYLRALLEGLSEAPERSEELRTRLREKVQRRGPEYLYRILARLDPNAAVRIAARDTQKVIRAVEMRLLTGKSIDEIHGAGRVGLAGYDVVKIGLNPPRTNLYAKIDARTEQMLQADWLDEVRRLIAAGIPGSAKPFQFIGYSELRRQIENQLDEDGAGKAIRQATRQFAKRQLTWFRREAGVHWLAGFGDDSEIAAAALEACENRWRRLRPETN
jgi:tRNA dimethylallyltransferase